MKKLGAEEGHQSLFGQLSEGVVGPLLGAMGGNSNSLKLQVGRYVNGGSDLLVGSPYVLWVGEVRRHGYARRLHLSDHLAEPAPWDGEVVKSLRGKGGYALAKLLRMACFVSRQKKGLLGVAVDGQVIRVAVNAPFIEGEDPLGAKLADDMHQSAHYLRLVSLI